MSEDDLQDQVDELERKLTALQSAVIALSLNQPIRVNSDGFIEAAIHSGPYAVRDGRAFELGAQDTSLDEAIGRYRRVYGK